MAVASGQIFPPSTLLDDIPALARWREFLEL